MTFWDWFYGTDIQFQRTELDKKRHFRIHSLESAREIDYDLDQNYGKEVGYKTILHLALGEDTM